MSSDAHCVWLRHCEKETPEETEGQVKGLLPKWLEGKVTRNGPGKMQVGETQYHHLFDSLAMLHQFNISSGKVTYRTRFLESDAYKKNMAANRIVITEFGTAAYPDPCMTLYERFKNLFTIPTPEQTMTDNCLVNVCQVKDEMYAMSETMFVRKIHPDTLETLDKVNLGKYFAVNLATAHPHIESNGDVFNMGSSFMSASGPCYNVVKMPQGRIEEGKVVASVPSRFWTCPSYFHSFAITENYWILIEQPLVFQIPKIISGAMFYNAPPMEALTWMPEEKTYFRVIERSTGKLISTVFTSDPFVTFHHTNAWEEDGNLILDLCGTEDGDIVKMLFVSNLEKKTTDSTRLLYGSTMRRYILPLTGVEEASVGTNIVKSETTNCKAIKKSDGSVHCTTHILHTDFFDMPRINYKYNGKSYRYAYGVSTKGNDLQFERLVKLDVKTGNLLVFTEDNYTIAEPIFVPSPDAIEEDDGIILSTIIKKTDPFYVALLVLDAKDMKEIARAEFKANGKATSSFHGQFVGIHEVIHAY